MGTAIVTLLVFCYLAMIVFSSIASRCVKGSRERYVFASAAWAAVPGAVAEVIVAAFIDAVSDDPARWPFALQGAALAWSIYSLVKDDDDNYWRRKRRRLVKRLRAWRRPLVVPVTVGATR